MANLEIFGESEEENKIKDNIKAREIVQTVIEYGVNEAQVKQMIYLLALNLEDNDLMREITSLIKQSSEQKTTKSIIMGE